MINQTLPTKSVHDVALESVGAQAVPSGCQLTWIGTQINMPLTGDD